MAEEMKTRLEALIIEWNSIERKRNTVDTYRFFRSNYLICRIPTVPPQLHDSFKY